MNTWNPDQTIKAWNFASAAHQGQHIPGIDLPYITHVGNVTMEAMAALAQSQAVERPDLLVQCALLHDVIEDTDATYQVVEAEFGPAVAEGVLALSKDKRLPTKKAQMKDSIARIKEQPPEIWMVKLADRITNLQPPPPYWDNDKIKNYRAEATLILQELGQASQYLADRLAQKIADYEAFIR